MKLDVRSWPVAGVGSALARHDAVVVVASLHALDDALADATRTLSAHERARYEGYTNVVVARRFAMARAIVRQVLGEALGMTPTAVPIVSGLHGKPRLAYDASARPLWFSVAHTEDLAIVALSYASEIGVDVERIRAIEQWERVADRVLDPAERAQLRVAVDAGEDPGTAFLRHWCRVEAELKAIGCGIAGLEAHLAGKRPLGLRVRDLDVLPMPADVVATGVRYQASVALCAAGVESARQSAFAANQASAPTTRPARASTA